MRLRGIWVVKAGIIPGRPDPGMTRQFPLTSAEWDGGSEQGYLTFLARQKEAKDYAEELERACACGRACNWTDVEFVWF